MKREHRLFCIGHKDCAAGHSCMGGECKEDPVPDPPFAPIDTIDPTQPVDED